MAKKYEYVENITELLGEKNLGALGQRISSTEKKLSDILKKISLIEADCAEREAVKADREAEKANEEAMKSASESSAKIPEKNLLPKEKIVSQPSEKEELKISEKEVQVAEEKTSKKEVKVVEEKTFKKVTQKQTSALEQKKMDIPKKSAQKVEEKVSLNAPSVSENMVQQPVKEIAVPKNEEKISSKTEEKIEKKVVSNDTPLQRNEKVVEKKSEKNKIISEDISSTQNAVEKTTPKRVETGNVAGTHPSTGSINNGLQSHSAPEQTFNPNAPRPAGAKRPPMRFVNGKAVGVYVAKPGVDNGNNSSYRPRANGDRPYTPRANGDRPYTPRTNGDRPYTPRANGDRPYTPRTNGDRPYTSRTPNQRPRTNGASVGIDAPIIKKETKQFTSPAKKKTFDKTYVEKKPVSKRTLIKQQGMSVEDFDESKSGYRKLRTPKKQKQQEIPTIKIDHAVVASLEIPLKVLSDKLGISAVEITKRLFKQGIMKSINDSIDYDNAALIALDMGIDLEYKPEKTAEDVLHDVVTEQDADKMITRAPVVTVMGHVDHGKTSLLDKIRSTSVTTGEAGGITQSIGAYSVVAKGKHITFIDTPGHAAFSAMRARGAKVTDIVVLVVAADDGIMPQTIEAINHAKAANVPIIVAMNKMDKRDVNPDKVKQQLLEQGLVSEEWGGDTMIIPVSAKTGMGIDELLDAISLVAEMQELKADPERPAKGTIIEAKLDKGKGPVASIIVENGTLHTGDNILSGTTMGRVRAMFDDKGKIVKSAGPSMAVSVLGFEDVPSAGDSLMAVDQSLMKQVQEERKNKQREGMIKEQSTVTLDDVFAQVEEGKIKNLNLIVKGDVQGSVEAVKQSLEKLSNEEVHVKVIHAAAGAINESDVMLAESAKAIIIGFNVRPDTKAKKLAESSKVDVRSYRIIYELIDDMQKALKGMLAPKIKETLSGKCEVRQTFNITGAGTIAGCYVLEGKIVRGGKLRIYRDDIMICEGGVKQLKRFKDDVKEVAYGFECGCAIEGFNEIRIGDIIECYITEEVKAE